jgi:quinol monooxygenase YgiN
MNMKDFAVACAVAAGLTFGVSAVAQTPPQAGAPQGNVTVVTIIDVLSNANVPQNVENSNALLNKLVTDSEHMPGAVSIKVLREAARSNHFIIFAVWKDMKSFEDYRAAESTRGFRQALQPRLGGPFDERLYVDLK